MRDGKREREDSEVNEMIENRSTVHNVKEGKETGGFVENGMQGSVRKLMGMKGKWKRSHRNRM